MKGKLMGLAGVLIPAAAMLTACEQIPCTPTATRAREAAVADAKAPLESAVLEARLTAVGAGVGHKTIDFLIDESGELVGHATTRSDGIARLDLKKTPTRLAARTQGKNYRAVFAGDYSYCGSADAASFKLVRV